MHTCSQSAARLLQEQCAPSSQNLAPTKRPAKKAPACLRGTALAREAPISLTARTLSTRGVAANCHRGSWSTSMRPRQNPPTALTRSLTTATKIIKRRRKGPLHRLPNLQCQQRPPAPRLQQPALLPQLKVSRPSLACPRSLLDS